jgi:peroxiredoxin
MGRSAANDRPRFGVAQVAVLVIVVAMGAVLVTRYLFAITRSAQLQRTSGCLALDPQRFGLPAPDFDLPDLQGVRHRLSGYRGKVVLLNFWATWCPPCVEELPSLAQLHRATAGRRDVALVTVSVDENAKVVREFLDRHRTVFGPFPVLIDPSKKVAKAFGTVKFPETYLVDRKGIVRYRFINKRDWSSAAAQACIRSLL